MAIERKPKLGKVGLFEPAEPCLHEEGVRPWDLLCTPMGRGYGYRMIHLATPSLFIYHETYDASVRLRGLGPPDMLAVLVPVRETPQSRYWKNGLGSASLPCTISSAVDVEFGAGQRHFVALIGLPLLQRYLPPETAATLARSAGCHFMPSSPTAIRRLRGWLCRVLREAHGRPEMLSASAAVHSLEEDMVLRLGAAVEAEAPDLSWFRCAYRFRGLDRALGCLRSHERRPITLPDLCREAGITQRTLERAFQDRFDMTPWEYIRTRRYNAARCRLLEARPGDTRVADIAYDLGFYELGRFAAAYAAMFGERPSETLRRDAPTPGSPLLA